MSDRNPRKKAAPPRDASAHPSTNSEVREGAASSVAVQVMPIGSLKANPSNPRVIRDEKFTKLVRSLVRFPTMLEKRPIVHVERVVLGGNQRLRAIETILGDWKKAAAHLQGLPDRERGVAEAFWAEAVKHKALPASCIADASGWTEEQRREFTVKDNVGYGEWNWDELANEWDAEDLSDWGLDLPKDPLPDGGEEEDYTPGFRLVIECTSEAQQRQYFKEITNLGIECKPLTL